jgi:protein-disulfide isomerase
MKRIILSLAAAVLFLLPAGMASAQSLNAQEQAEVRALVRDYLVNNPDVLEDALDALADRKDAERKVRIETDPRDFSMGPRNAPITIVEFFDYRCPYCHAGMEWMRDIVATRRDVRVVFKELPLLGPASFEAARAAVAAQPQGRYWAFHQALMDFRGELDSDRIDALARQSGIDVARMRRAMDDAAVTAHLEDNRELAIDAGINSTPTFMINGEMVVGLNLPRVETVIREAARNARTAQR